VLDKNAKRSPAALMDAEIFLGGTMGAGLAMARVIPRFEFFRVVLDF
jgi:hypothetical protein